ncbi:MAG: GGDEF domain-containing protein [Christensenella sp.]|nr:GGDEF domain-containing protein [Christensenella sp.]
MMTHQTRNQISLCVMIGDVSYDFSMELMQGILNTAEREGVQVLYMMGMPRHAGFIEPGSEQITAYHHNSIYDYAYMFGADAYILSCGSLSGFDGENTYQQFLKRFDETPSVILQEQIDMDQSNKSCITVDNYSSFCQCIEHLIVAHHCHKICLLAGVKNHPDIKERMRAYFDTMRKYDLPVEESMIAYGDFSEFSDPLVSRLFDENPDIDAIAFCNDEMARGGYRECAKRGIRVGKDIAFTGFDNFSTSRTLMPPLTTVSQNIYEMGEMAVFKAVDLVCGRPVSSTKLETKLQIRRSCGCLPDAKLNLFSLEGIDCALYADCVLQRIAADLKACYDGSERERSETMIDRLIGRLEREIETDAKIDQYGFADWMQTFTDEFTSATYHVALRLNEYLGQMPAENLRVPKVRKLYDVLGFTQGFLLSYKARMVEKNLDDFRAQSWFIPEFIRDLVDSDLEEESIFYNIVKRLRGINLNSIYICLLPEAQPLQTSQVQHAPEKLLLAAYGRKDDVRAFARAQMPVIDTTHPLRDLPGLERHTHLMSFSIFSGNIQYGILLCEVDMARSSLLHVIGLQLGILINFLDLKRKEQIIGSELENIRERNQILNFLSDYDPLCNILNRRGFIEQAIRLNRENAGKPGLCVFMDLDHLKEINDTFGHSEGDMALSALSDILKQAVRRNDLIARLGGDEFVGMFIVDSPDFGEVFTSRIRQAFDEYNRNSTRPYYVEASMGIAYFTCQHNLEISQIVNEADRYLYEEKKKKRMSVLKQKCV